MSLSTLSSRVGLLQPSPTLALTARIGQLRAQGRRIISFAAGEPDFNTPDAVCEAAERAIRAGLTKYCASSGLPQLRAAVAESLLARRGLEYAPEQIVVSCGAKHCLFNSLMTLVEPGDEVIVISPYWMTYADQISLAGGSMVIVEAAATNGYLPRIEDLRAAVTPRTRAIILNSPCNPTGAVYPRELIARIGQLALDANLWLISDEIYERLTYGVEHVGPADIAPEVKERTVLITGCSKSYAMTGWRIGFSAAPIAISEAMGRLQDQVTSNATTFAQAGAIAALKLPDAEVEQMRSKFEIRRDRMYGWFAKMPGVAAGLPSGAFYIFADFSAALPAGVTDSQFAERLLELGVGVVPGSAFGAPGALRFSYTASLEDIDEGMAIVASALANGHDS